MRGSKILDPEGGRSSWRFPTIRLLPINKRTESLLSALYPAQIVRSRKPNVVASYDNVYHLKASPFGISIRSNIISGV